MLMRFVFAMAIGVTSLNAAEHEAVAAVLVMEAGGEGEKGLRAVMEVIQNRARERHDTRFDVIRAKKQFEVLNARTVKDLIDEAKQHKLWKMALTIALQGTQTNLTHGADHYHERTITPYWADPTKRTGMVGKHVFYRLKSGRK